MPFSGDTADPSRPRADPPAGLTAIRARLALAFGTLLVLIVGLGAVSLHQLEALRTSTDEISAAALPKLIALHDIDAGVGAHAVLARSRMETRDFRQLAKIEADMRAVADSFARSVADLSALPLGPQELALAGRLQTRWEEHVAAVARTAALLEQGDLDGAEALFADRAARAADEAAAVVAALLTRTEAEAEDIAAVAAERYAQARLATAGAVAVGLAAMLVASAWVTRKVSLPLLRISAEMRRITHGEDPQDARGRPGRVDEIAILRDAAAAFRTSVLESRALARDLGRQRALLEAMVRNMPLGLCLFDANRRLVLANPAFRAIFGMRAQDHPAGAPEPEVLAAIAARLADEAQRRAVADGLGARRRGDGAVWRLDDGRSVSTLIQPTPDGWMLIFEDISERVAAEAHVRRLARHDALTGLPNRRTFAEEIDAALAAADPDAPAAVMFIDLDRFKHVNDTLGHGVGDALLKLVADRLNWAVREHDTVARFGGDEFAVIQRGRPQPASARALGERIVALLGQPFDIDGTPVSIGGSVGIALAPGDGDDAEEVLRSADAALYAVKAAGRGHCRFYSARMREEAQAKLQLERDLRQALRDEAFSMHYQPLFDIAQDAMCGAEALLRWRHPTRGMVPPAEFVPLAEELGLMPDLGARVIRQACLDAAQWPAPLRVAVNVSPAQFARGDLLGDVDAALEASGLPASRLEIEITEGVLLEHTDRVLETLRRLHDRGIRIALDDFGTGYSSLQYLRAFPFGKVKIDASFVRELQVDEGAAAIVRAVCALCGSLGIRVTAEGIETREQLLAVAREGCAEAQGFHLGRPRPAEEMLAAAASAAARASA